MKKGRKLYLGGVEIPHPAGLLGHSDGDGLIHALIDALLGASGEGDIGRLFPDSDPAFKDMRSTELLRRVRARLEKKKMKVLNVDLVIDADGFGGPVVKARKYNLITDPEEYPFIEFRAIKLFFFNPYEERHHGDKPEMTWPEVFGKEEVSEGLKIRHLPDVVIVA